MKTYMIFLWIASIAIAIVSGIVVYRSFKNEKHTNRFRVYNNVLLR